MRHLLVALALAVSSLCAANFAQAQAPHARGPAFGYRGYAQANPARPPHVYRGWFGHQSRDFGPNYYGTGGFYGREYYGPGTGVYYRVPGGSGVYGY